MSPDVAPGDAERLPIREPALQEILTIACRGWLETAVADVPDLMGVHAIAEGAAEALERAVQRIHRRRQATGEAWPPSDADPASLASGLAEVLRWALEREKDVINSDGDVDAMVRREAGLPDQEA